MKQTLSLLLIALTVPVNAQQTADAFDLRRAIAREAERFAEDNSSRSDEQSQSAASNSSNWSRVEALATSTSVEVLVHGLRYSSRYFVAADERELTVLNLVNPWLPADVRRVLSDLARRKPSFFAAGQQPEEFVEGNVRIGPEGLFISGQKVSTFEHLVERFSRSEIAEIRVDRDSSGTFMGNFGGFFVIGTMIAGAIVGGKFGHRQFQRYKPSGAVIGAYGGLAAGIASGIGIMRLGGAFGKEVLYRVSP
jgi:hypothetical protein